MYSVVFSEMVKASAIWIDRQEMEQISFTISTTVPMFIYLWDQETDKFRAVDVSNYRFTCEPNDAITTGLSGNCYTLKASENVEFDIKVYDTQQGVQVAERHVNMFAYTGVYGFTSVKNRVEVLKKSDICVITKEWPAGYKGPVSLLLEAGFGYNTCVLLGYNIRKNTGSAIVEVDPSKVKLEVSVGGMYVTLSLTDLSGSLGTVTIDLVFYKYR